MARRISPQRLAAPGPPVLVIRLNHSCTWRSSISSRNTQHPITDIGNLWSKLRDEAGLPGVRIHDLRHSFASHAAAHSETLPMIGKLLGHADVRTTTRYAHLDDGHVIEAAQRIGDLIEQNMSGSYSLSRNTKYDSGPLLHD